MDKGVHISAIHTITLLNMILTTDKALKSMYIMYTKGLIIIARYAMNYCS